jgi:hypothetical protein
MGTQDKGIRSFPFLFFILRINNRKDDLVMIDKENHYLEIEINKNSEIVNLNFSSNKNKFNLSLNFGKIVSIQLIDESGLFIKFENGELRLDINKEQLEKIIQIF